ncbi:hypothetical protein ACTOB_005996 [Actinoplanes oblitus]|uniref:Uncharacterized protein n=1 Tax=Actinoplanes oblitus TaxID=3040509 RepID=A0ABY8W829_9ACTN|nr:hypothetical protein [Actinoplanes oblitus]WIM93996.1 hypothetical protein ACTOB_005996 [Actinoplanes oblitus]
MTRLIVERVHHLSSRPWLFVTGRLEGEALRIGDELTVWDGGVAAGLAVVRSIELHAASSHTTVAVESDLASAIQEGAVLARE